MKKYFKTTGKSLLYIVLYLMLQVLLLFIAGIVLGVAFYEDTEQAVDLLVRNMYLVLIISGGISLFIYKALLKKKQLTLSKVCNFKKIPMKQYLVNAILAIAFSFVTGGIVYFLGDYFPSYYEVSNDMVNSMGTIFGVITIVILVPIFEEVLFRGIVLSELKSNMNLIVAVILQSFLFGLIHGNVLQGLYTFALGIITALVCIWSKSIMSAIAIHIFFNLSGTIIEPLVLYYTPQYTVLYMILGAMIVSVCLLILYKKRDISNSYELEMAEISKGQYI